MGSIRFQAGIEHSEKSINSFAKTQFNVYRTKQRNFMLLISVLMLTISVFAPLGDTMSALLVFAACLILVDIGHIPKRTARLILKQMPELDSFEYQFGEKTVKICSTKNGASGVLAYSKIEKLAEDLYNFYMFVNENTGYMFSKKSLSPADRNAFKSFLSSASGCRWNSAKGVLGINFQSLIDGFKK